MRNLQTFVFLVLSFWIFISCGSSSDLLASESIRERKIFCNPFAEKGFRGVLSVNSSQNNFSYASNTLMLYFYDVPDSFKTQRDTYVQLYAVNYINNKSSFSKEGLEMDVLNLKSGNRASITPYIDHKFIQNEDYDFNDFFADHAFIVRNTSGWDVLFIGLFNEHDESILQMTTLIPPFESNPYIYEENKEGNQTLNQLHPFNHLKTNIERTSDDVFLSKAETACRENPI